jgi:hypothetical protein
MTTEKKMPPRLLWVAFFITILVLALIAGFAALRGGRQLLDAQLQQSTRPVQEILYIILNEQQRIVPESKRMQLSLDMQDQVNKEQALLEQQMQQQIDIMVDSRFAPVHDYVENFADWYYSLTGEYMRYAHAIGGDMSEYMQQRFQETVFLPAALEANVDSMLADLNEQLLQKLAQSGARLSSRLQLVVAANSWPVGNSTPVAGDSLDLDQLFAKGFQLSAADINRQLFAGVAATGAGVAVAKGMGAVVAKKIMFKVAGSKSFHIAAALLAKLAAKSAVKGGGVLAGAGAGAAVCSPTGPGALVCGAVGGLIAWIVIDKAAIELDEALNRDVFERDIHQAIDTRQHELKVMLQEAVRAVLEAGFVPLHKSSQRMAVPAGEFTPVDIILDPAPADYEKPAGSPGS